MFGRHPRTPIEMEEEEETLEETANNKEEAIFESDADMDRMVANRDSLMTRVDQQVQQNVLEAQAKQQKQFAKRKLKGVKVFQFSIGDLVLRKVMKNVGRKGGKLDALWTAPYRIVDIDDHQRKALEYPETGQLLKVKALYQQVRPHKTSHLHEPQTVARVCVVCAVCCSWYIL
ncbi:uncharacterized protein LOC134176258 [Corticium candelabrum]|uniref:uncharacterized protein LOC134176258 n=1 Tax=Corticium candelabrum TaxID=121492 RepID=UPI002E272995|nr:uncharacterized protein LOC134176258 [Corticium candelabrum]